MPANDIRFVLRVPAEVYVKLREFSKTTGLSINRIICDRLEEPNGNMRKERGKVEPSQVQDGEVQKVRGGSKEDASGGGKPEGEKATRKSAGAHDQKTCRVYRCAQCVAGGKKF